MLASDTNRGTGGVSSTRLVILGATGGVGSALLDLIQKERSKLANVADIEVVGVANSRHFVEGADPKGLPSAQTVSDSIAGHPSGDGVLYVLVDCTASPDVLAYYPQAFAAGWGVVAASKLLNAGPIGPYLQVRAMANGRFLYGANVGAGLPIITAIQQARHEVIGVRAILSGTLSYVFGRLDDQGVSLSEALKDAQKLGYTEPNPLEDLGGQDVIRKLLILARELGFAGECADVQLGQRYQDFVAGAQGGADIDHLFEEFYPFATAPGARLRFIGSLSVTNEGVRAHADLERVKGEADLMGSVKDANNCVEITKRDGSRQVIWGKGAGYPETARGVFRDILSLAGVTCHISKVVEGRHDFEVPIRYAL